MSKDTHKEYWDSVTALADEIIKEVKEGDLLEGEMIYDAVFWRVDGNYWVIYTHAAYKVWEFSDNEDAIDDAVEEGIWEYGDKPFDQILSAMAFFAMRRDVEEEIEKREHEIYED